LDLDKKVIAEQWQKEQKQWSNADGAMPESTKKSEEESLMSNGMTLESSVSNWWSDIDSIELPVENGNGRTEIGMKIKLEKEEMKLKQTWKSEFGNRSGFWMDSTVESTWNQEWILDGFGIGIDVEPAFGITWWRIRS